MKAKTKPITALIPLPLFYNADLEGNRKKIEDEYFIQTAEEIARRFGGGTLFRFQHDSPRGFWWDKGIIYYDQHALLEIDFPDTKANRRWLENYARRVLLERFQQEAIYLKFVGPVDNLVVTGTPIRKSKKRET